MSQSFQMAEAIILRVIPFRDYDQILILFTLEAGLIKVLHKGNKSKRQGGQGSCIPLTQIEVIYLEKRGEIFSCQDITFLNSFSALRKELLYLEVGCDLLQVILRSQLVGKPAPQLYALLCFYLKKIPSTCNPWVLASSFRLKLLKYEGLVSFPFICSECQEMLKTVAYTQGSESWCNSHQPMHSWLWEQTELEHFYRLANCQSYSEICSEPLAEELKNKIMLFFETCIKR